MEKRNGDFKLKLPKWLSITFILIIGYVGIMILMGTLIFIKEFYGAMGSAALLGQFTAYLVMMFLCYKLINKLVIHIKSNVEWSAAMKPEEANENGMGN